MAAAPGPSLTPQTLLGDTWCQRVSAVACQLWDLGLGSASEEAYIVAVNGHVESQLRQMTEGVFDRPLLGLAERCAGAG